MQNAAIAKRDLHPPKRSDADSCQGFLYTKDLSPGTQYTVLGILRPLMNGFPISILITQSPLGPLLDSSGSKRYERLLATGEYVILLLEADDPLAMDIVDLERGLRLHGARLVRPSIAEDRLDLSPTQS